MTSCVTGATGFVGTHVARALVARGDRVRCLVRQGSPRDNLAGLDVEPVVGDLGDGESVRRAVEGCDLIFHCAADYRLYVPDPETMYAANVDGTNNVMQAARDCGAKRVVYCSSVGALGLHADGTAADETAPVSEDDMVGHYKKSKYRAERIAEEWAERGLPVVIVNPSAPVGDRDIKPTATGQMILDFLNRKMAAYVDTGLNLVDVRDVAQGHLLAAERGKIGEKYILGHRNMSLKEILDTLGRLTGLPSPRLRLPHSVPLVVSAIDTCLARVFGRQPRFAYDAVKLSRKKMYFDGSKAVGELGMPQTPIEEALGRAVEWFRTNGYVKNKAAA